MGLEEIYMNNKPDLSGSMAKNRFNFELLWGVDLLIDLCSKSSDDFYIVFDNNCDIELHLKNGFEYYQIKTDKNKSFTIKRLTNINKNKKNSILGTLYKLNNSNKILKLGIVSNDYLSHNKSKIENDNYCFSNLEKKLKNEIDKNIKKELGIESDIEFNKIHFIKSDIPLNNQYNNIKGKLDNFLHINRKESKIRATPLFVMLKETIDQKATCEELCINYTEVLEKKGISRKWFEGLILQEAKEELLIERVNDFIRKNYTIVARVNLLKCTVRLKKEIEVSELVKNNVKIILKSIDENNQELSNIKDESGVVKFIVEKNKNLIANRIDIEFLKVIIIYSLVKMEAVI